MIVEPFDGFPFVLDSHYISLPVFDCHSFILVETVWIDSCGALGFISLPTDIRPVEIGSHIAFDCDNEKDADEEACGDDNLFAYKDSCFSKAKTIHFIREH